MEQFAPKRADIPDFYETENFDSVISLKAETHNFPTTVEPFNGAATGSGGEIRDRLAGGKGSLPLAGTAVYMTSYSRLDESKEGTQWYTNVPQLEKLGAQTNFQDLGSLEISPAALEKTAEQYMNILQGTISDLFQSVSDLSKNINSYFIEKRRSNAIQKGNEAIKNADEIENALVRVTKQETGAET